MTVKKTVKRLVKNAPRFLENISVSLPYVGKVTIPLVDEYQLNTAWKIFVETSTRIVTQKLEPGTGRLQDALTSLYGTFSTVRDELKAMPAPDPALTPDAMSVEVYALQLLNDALRPCLARWHPRYEKWRATGMPEAQWPLATLLRQDLEAARQRALIYTWGLGQVAGIPTEDLARLLPPEPDSQNLPAWVDEATLYAREAGIDPNLGTSLTQTGWRIYVEVKSAGAYLAAASDRQDSASHLKLHKRLNVLVYLLRGELKRADGPTPPTAMQGDSVESLTLNLIGTLEGVLSHWPTDHLALSTNNLSASAATAIPELETELITLVNAINTTAGKLGELLGVVEAA